MTPEDLVFIEKFYADIEAGYTALGKTYTRPADYIERALRILTKGRKLPVRNQKEKE